mgnify:CR=1 FL=1
MFSSAFTPVKRWNFEENPHMGNHLRVCPFNRTYKPKGPSLPVQLPSMDCWPPKHEDFTDIMKRMYPSFGSTESEA